ncbi:MAG: hypothetical protein KC912_06905 [Proteobacteria bacterium]|nr:hypothetical protein [Pseudomonadota bacterium]
MIFRTLAVLALFAPAAALADSCPTATTVAELDETLSGAEASYRSVDLDGFNLAVDSAVFLIPCLGERLTPTVAAHFHRMQGLSAVIRRKNDRAAQAFTSAKAADPSYAWPDELIPPGHIIRTTYDDADPEASKYATPAPPVAGALIFDGTPSDRHPTSRPTVFQLTDADGVVLKTFLVRAGADLPEYEAKVVPVAAPEPAEPVAVGTEEPKPVKTGDSSGAVALPAAITGGAVALGAGSAVLYFGPTKSAFSEYQTMRSSGDYAGADTHFDEKVVPPRTTAQVLAGASIVALGVSGYLWSQAVSVSPTPNGLLVMGSF